MKDKTMRKDLNYTDKDANIVVTWSKSKFKSMKQLFRVKKERMHSNFNKI